MHSLLGSMIAYLRNTQHQNKGSKRLCRQSTAFRSSSLKIIETNEKIFNDQAACVSVIQRTKSVARNCCTFFGASSYVTSFEHKKEQKHCNCMLGHGQARDRQDWEAQPGVRQPTVFSSEQRARQLLTVVKIFKMLKAAEKTTQQASPMRNLVGQFMNEFETFHFTRATDVLKSKTVRRLVPI
jgi:hypothetical protein